MSVPAGGTANDASIMRNMAAFVLVPDSDTLDRLTEIIARLQAWELPAIWTAPEALRVELFHLGACGREAAVRAARNAEDAALGAMVRNLSLSGLGGVGGSEQVDAAWGAPALLRAAVADPTGCLEDLRFDLADAITQSPGSVPPAIILARPQTGEVGHVLRRWPHLIEAHGEAQWGPCGVTRLQVELDGGEVIAGWDL